MGETGLLAWRRGLARMFDDDLPPNRAGQIFHGALATLIFTNVCGVILESVDIVNQRFGTTLWWLEQLATVVFAIEYAAHAWASVDFLDPRFHHPFWGRLRYLRASSR